MNNNPFLVSAYTGLGNFILKTPFLKELKTNFPNSEIHIITGNSFGTEFLLQGSDLISKSHILEPSASKEEKKNFFKSLRKYNYQAIFLAFDADPNFLLKGSYIAKIKTIVKHTDVYYQKKIFSSIKFLIKKAILQNIQFVKIANNRHEISLNLDLLEKYLNKKINKNGETFLPKRDPTKTLLKFNLEPNNYFIIQASAANGTYLVKAWEPKNFIYLIKEIEKTYPSKKIVLVGDNGDFKRVINPLIQELNKTGKINKSIINTAGKTSISELLDLISAAQITICHDSGVMHMADALSRPLIALYGPTDYIRTRPLKINSKVIQSSGEYKNCMKNFATTEQELSEKGIGHQAMENIKVSDIIDLMSTFNL